MRAKILTTTIALALGLILPAAAYAQQSPQAQQPSSQQQSGYQQATERGETSIQVQQPAAEVTVTEQSPDVTVEQPQPEVRVRQREPQVTVQQPDPQVTVETAAPDVTVRETGEPDVRVQQRESQPDLRVTEDQDREDRQAEDRHDRELHLYDQGGPALVGPESGNDQTQQTERTATAASRIAALGSELVGKAIYGADDKKIGEVEDVVMGRGGDAEAVLTRVGGFLGIGSRQVALPVDRLQMDGDRINATDITKKEVENMPKYQGQN